MEPRLSLRPGASAYAEQRPEYLAQLVAPMDDMWATFADLAVPHALLVDGEVVGSCSLDDEGRLLRFFVMARHQHHSVPLLRKTLGELGARHMMVATLDPGALSSALDLASKVESHSLFYRLVADPDGPGLEGLRRAGPEDHARIVDYDAEETGAPRGFLEAYIRERLERRELWLLEEEARLLCVGELRHDKQQTGVAQLGLVVTEARRGQGIGTRMLASLVELSRAQGLRPHCSTELGNAGARRAIERAGFRADHRLLSVELAP